MNQEFNIVSHFLEKADLFPDKIAIVDQYKEISFGELKKQVLETANYYLEKGIKKGSRVLVFVPMGIDLYRSVLALFHLGATAVFLDEWVSKKRMELCCQVAKCDAFIGIFKARVLAFFSKELRKIPIKLSSNFKQAKQSYQIEKTILEDTALITFTTGSSGIPKAAKRTHGFLNEQFKALIDKIQPKENEVDLTILPIVLLINLGVGTTSIISNFKAKKPESLDSGALIDTLKRYKVNRIIASPYFVKYLAHYLIKNPQELNHLNIIYTGGAPVFQADAKLILSAFQNVKLDIVFGSTEAEPISSIDGEILIQEKSNSKGLNVGFPYHGTEVKIIQISDKAISCDSESDLDAISLAKNQIGEIIVSGSHVLQSYLNNQEALLRNKIFIEPTCWHRTADSGFLSDSGELFLTGPCSKLIYRENEIISPFVCENKLMHFKEIELATLIEINSKLILAIELKKHLNEAGKENLNLKLKELDFPFSQVIYLTKIPRDPRHHSKIDYSELKNQVQRLFSK